MGTEPRFIDLNFDGGEGFDDEALAPFATTTHVACGAHAGDAASMRTAAALCRGRGLALGAHPSYPDRAGFGRRRLAMAASDVAESVRAQVEALATVAASEGLAVTSVKPHGALYHATASDDHLAGAIAEAVARLDPRLVLVGSPGSSIERAALAASIRFVAEGFADRGYGRDGLLVPRGQPGALKESPEEAAAQAFFLASSGEVRAIDGTRLTLAVGTICLHGDTPGAASNARAVRRALDAAGVTVRRFC